jgi:hypothetical protein
MEAVGAVTRWVSRSGVTLALAMAVLWPTGASAQIAPDAGTAPPADAGVPSPATEDPDAGTAQPRTPDELEEPEEDGAAGTDAPSDTGDAGSAASGTTAATPTTAGSTSTTGGTTESSTGTTTPGTTATTTTPRQTARTDASRAPRRPAPADDEEAEDEEEEEDRFRFAYLEVSGGMSWINLAVINQDNFVPEFDTMKGTGFAVGGGAGFFLSFVTLGLQAEYANHDGFDVGVVALDLGIRIPTPFIEPYLRVGIGYAWLFNLDRPVWDDVGSIRGVAADVGLGFDFMITPLVAVGIGVDAAVFNVRRSGTSGAPEVGMVVLEDDGDAVGVQVSALAQLNLHF